MYNGYEVPKEAAWSLSCQSSGCRAIAPAAAVDTSPVALLVLFDSSCVCTVSDYVCRCVCLPQCPFLFFTSPEPGACILSARLGDRGPAILLSLPSSAGCSLWQDSLGDGVGAGIQALVLMSAQ